MILWVLLFLLLKVLTGKKSVKNKSAGQDDQRKKSQVNILLTEVEDIISRKSVGFVF